MSQVGSMAPASTGQDGGNVERPQRWSGLSRVKDSALSALDLFDKGASSNGDA
jgi:hypothetical protein